MVAHNPGTNRLDFEWPWMSWSEGQNSFWE